MQANAKHNAESDSTVPAAGRDANNAALAALQAHTPARLLVGRAGTGYRTSTQLKLREDHAAAVDAVHAEMNIVRDFGQAFVERFELVEVTTQAQDKSQFLQQPALGRTLSPESIARIEQCCPKECTLQVAIGDGLSAAAVAEQVPPLLRLSEACCLRRGWTFGRPFAIRHCRVGGLNDIGDRLEPEVVVLLIGERPGLVTAVSLSAYMAFRPRAGHTDANRNLISNIHARGVPPDAAAERILALAELMLSQQTSGIAVKERLPHAQRPVDAPPNLDK